MSFALSRSPPSSGPLTSLMSCWTRPSAVIGVPVIFDCPSACARIIAPMADAAFSSMFGDDSSIRVWNSCSVRGGACSVAVEDTSYEGLGIPSKS